MKKLINLLLLCLLTANTFSQIIEREYHPPIRTNFYDDVVEPANFIFEGTVEKVELKTVNMRFYALTSIQIHKVFKGSNEMNKITLESELDSSSYVYFLSQSTDSKILNNFNSIGFTQLYFTTLESPGSDNQARLKNYQVLKIIRYYLNFDTYSYNYPDYLTMTALRFGDQIRGLEEVELGESYSKITTIKQLYDTLLSYPDIKLSYDDGIVFKQRTAQDWLDAHPGMRPNLFKNIAEPKPPVLPPTPPDSAATEKIGEAKQRYEENIKKKVFEKLSPNEKRKYLRKQKKMQHWGIL